MNSDDFASYIKKNHPEVKDIAAIAVLRKNLENEFESEMKEIGYL